MREGMLRQESGLRDLLQEMGRISQKARSLLRSAPPGIGIELQNGRETYRGKPFDPAEEKRTGVALMGELQRIRFETREEWLAWRVNGIGASEAGAIMGDSKWQTKIDLWKIKTGATAQPDLSGSEVIQRGVRFEPAIRAVYAAMHPELRVVHNPYDVLFQSDRPWLFATLDAETYDKSDEPGTAEFKTAQPRNREEWEIWNNGVPANYYDQVLHQHLATGWRRHHLTAFLFRTDGDIIVRDYAFTVDDGFAMDAQIVLETETLFLDDIRNRRIPAMPLRI